MATLLGGRSSAALHGDRGGRADRCLYAATRVCSVLSRLLLLTVILDCAAMAGPSRFPLTHPPIHGLLLPVSSQTTTDVPQLQRLLRDIGLYHGPIDGKAGAALRQAALQYQRIARSRGLTSDQEMAEGLLYSSWIMRGTPVSLERALGLVPDVRSAFRRIGTGEASLEKARYSEAESIFRGVQSTFDSKLGKNNLISLFALVRLAEALRLQGRYVEAMRIATTAQEALSSILGAKSDEAMLALEVIANIEVAGAEPEAGVAKLRKVIEWRAAAAGPRDPRVLSAQHNLGVALQILGEFAEAEKLFRALLKVIPQKPGNFNEMEFTARANLAGALTAQGRHAEAEAEMRRSIEMSGARWDLRVSLASILIEAGQYDEAEALLIGVMRELGDGSGFPPGAVGQAQAALGEAWLRQGRPGDAANFLREALVSMPADAPVRSLGWIGTQASFGKALAASGQLEEAEPALLAAISQFSAYLAKGGAVAEDLRRRAREILATYVDVLENGTAQGEGAARKAFVAQSWWTYGALEVSLADLGLRLSSNVDESRRALRDYQEVRDTLALSKAEYAALLGTSPFDAKRGQEVGGRIEALEKRKAELEGLISRDLPHFSDIVTPRPMTADETQALLRAGEAVLALMVTDQKVHAWLISRETVQWQTRPVGRERIESLVGRLRASVDFSGPPPSEAPPDGCSLDSPIGYLSDRPFDLCAAHELYSIAFGDFDLAAVDSLIVVADGPFTAIPFSLLVAGNEPGAKPEWLIDRVALSSLPTTNSLRFLRGDVRDEAGITKSFLGVAPGGFTNREKGSPLRIVPPDLPATIDEVRELAQLFPADQADLVTGDAADEAGVRASRLADYRVISFATHGLMASEAAYWTGGRVTEPALVLARGGAPENDGLLTASEVATLRLSADWVLLSGCNTASGQSADAESLSGLARAFFFAGAKSLLVSQWSVNDLAARLLMVRVVQQANAADGTSKAQALRRAMLDLKGTTGLEHPFFWAPFELVGESLPLRTQASPVLAPAGTDHPEGAAPVEMASVGTGQLAPALRGVVPRSALPGGALDARAEEQERLLGLDRAGRIEVQRRLTLLGHDPKGADGVFGPNTRTAIGDWQVARQLPRSGYLDAVQHTLLSEQSAEAYEKWKGSQRASPRKKVVKRVRKCLDIGIARICRTR